MSEIDSISDLELRSSQPQPLDDDFLARLTACADGSILELSSAELEFEKSLRAISPLSLPAALRTSLETTIGDIPFHSDEKIVLFNRSKETTDPVIRKPWWSTRANIAAAAAVALLGSISAFMLPGNQQETGNLTAANQTTSPRISTPVYNSNSPRVSPVGFNRNLSQTSDEGVIWQNNTSPHRVMRLSFIDRYTVTNSDGETLQLERPRDEYVIIPEKVD